MALRFPFSRNTAQAATAPVAPHVEQPPKARDDFYVHGDALPVPEAEEKNSDSIWALFTDAPEDTPEPSQEALLPDFLQSDDPTAPRDGNAARDDSFEATFPATHFMDLPDLLKGRE